VSIYSDVIIVIAAVTNTSQGDKLISLYKLIARSFIIQIHDDYDIHNAKNK